MINKEFVALIANYFKNDKEKKKTRIAWREPVVGVPCSFGIPGKAKK